MNTDLLRFVGRIRSRFAARRPHQLVLGRDVRGRRIARARKDLGSHLHVVGPACSGKTETVLKPLLHQLIRSDEPCRAAGGLLVASLKGPELASFVLAAAAAAGREDDVAVLGIGGNHTHSILGKGSAAAAQASRIIAALRDFRGMRGEPPTSPWIQNAESVFLDEMQMRVEADALLDLPYTRELADLRRSNAADVVAKLSPPFQLAPGAAELIAGMIGRPVHTDEIPELAVRLRNAAQSEARTYAALSTVLSPLCDPRLLDAVSHPEPSFEGFKHAFMNRKIVVLSVQPELGESGLAVLHQLVCEALECVPGSVAQATTFVLDDAEFYAPTRLLEATQLSGPWVVTASRDDPSALGPEWRAESVIRFTPQLPPHGFTLATRGAAVVKGVWGLKPWEDPALSAIGRDARIRLERMLKMPVMG